MLSTVDRQEWEETNKRKLKNFLFDLLKSTQAQTKVTDLVLNYKCFLKNKHPARVKSYFNLLKNQPASARAEAVTFHFLKANLDNVQVKEDPEKGGVDFECKTDDAKFVVEVTHLDSDSVARKSGLKNELPQNRCGGWYTDITDKLFQKTISKANQMSGYGCPTILTMLCEHPQSDMLLGTIDADYLLTGEHKIPIVPFSNQSENLNLITDLGNSVFFRFNEKIGKLEPCRRSISAILLFSVLSTNAFIVGILHPDPVHKLPIEFIPAVPFVRLKKWPPEKNILEVEWVSYKMDEHVGHKPEPHNFWYDKELRNI